MRTIIIIKGLMVDFVSSRNARLAAGAALGAVALSLAGPALAESAVNDDNQIVVTAAGFEQKLTDAPASISVVTAEELQQRPYITLIDAVRDLEGVDVGETSDKTGQRTISIRGMGSDYTLILINGKRQNNHGDIYPNSFGGNQFNHIPPLDTIERIEVIRGPASTLYGADALGGVINIITKRVADRWTGSATFGRSFQEDDSFGDDTTLDATITGPIVPGLLGISLRGSVYDRAPSSPDFEPAVDPAGEVHVRGLGFGGGGKTVANTNKSAGFTIDLTPTENQSLSVDFDISRQEYDNTPVTDPVTGSTSYPLGTVDSIDTIWRSANGMVSPRVGYSEEQSFERMNWAVTHEGEWGFGRSFVSLAYIETDNNGRTLPFSVAERVLLQDIYDGAGDYAGLDEDERRAIASDTFLPRPKRTLQSNQYTLDARLDIPLENLAGAHHLVVGGQYIDGELEDSVFGLEGSAEGLSAVQPQKQWSLFVEDNWSPIEMLTITGGIRYDEHDTFGGHVSPRLYAVFNATPTLTIKGGVSTGYKTPKTTDLYDGITGYGGQGTNPWTGNPDLKPETSVNSEIAIYWNPTPTSGINVTLFQNDFEDKIMRQPVTATCSETGGVRPCANLGAYWEILGIGGLSQPVNVDKAKIKGVEVAGRYQFFPGLSIRANYTLTDSEQKSGAEEGLPLTDLARHMANATLDWQATDRLSAQLMGEVRSRRYRGVDSISGDRIYYRSYEVLHLGAQYRFNDFVTVGVRVNNLLDQDFTSYSVDFADDGDGTWTPSYTDHYNNKDKARSYWVSVNARF